MRKKYKEQLNNLLEELDDLKNQYAILYEEANSKCAELNLIHEECFQLADDTIGLIASIRGNETQLTELNRLCMQERKRYADKKIVLAEKHKKEIEASAAAVAAVGGIGWLMSVILGRKKGNCDNKIKWILVLFLIVLVFIARIALGRLIDCHMIKKTKKNIEAIYMEIDTLNKKIALINKNREECEAQASVISGLLDELSEFEGANYQDIGTEDRTRLTQLVNDLRTLMAFLGEEI